MPTSYSGWAEWRRFSAAMLALVGAFNVVEGLVVIYDGNVVRVDPSRVLLLNLAGWAQVMLTLGAVLFSLAIWLSLVTVRVRLAALSVVCVHALTQLGVLAAFPAWALLMISFDVVIIFALTATPAGAAASVARTTTVLVPGGENAREVTARVPVGARSALHAGSATDLGGGRGGYRAGAGHNEDTVAYRPRHEMAGADATVLLSQLTDAVLAGTAPGPSDTVPPQRALPPAPSPATQAAGTDPDATRPAGTAPDPAKPTSAPAKPTGTRARGIAAPIIGAISGRWQ